jgi:hypothetical protein
MSLCVLRTYILSVQPLKKFPTFYKTRSFITAFQRALHWSLSLPRSIQSVQHHPTSHRSILLSSSHVLVFFCLFLSCVPQKSYRQQPLFLALILFFCFRRALRRFCFPYRNSRALSSSSIQMKTKTQWPESVSKLFRPSDRCLWAKLVPTFADRGYHVVSVTNPDGCILGFLDRSRYFFFQVAPQLYPRGWVDPIPDPLLLRKSGSSGNRTRYLWICSQELSHVKGI